MRDPAVIKRLDKQISVAADLIVEYRHLIEHMDAGDRNAEAAQAALKTLEKVLRHRLLERLDLQDNERPVRNRRVSH
jgi:hypothetical protein